MPMTFNGVFCLLHVFIFLTSTLAGDPILTRFQQYLQINTAHPSPNYHEAADFILSQAKSLSLESHTIEFVKNKPLILLKWTGKNPNLPSILLNSHTDVVPVEPHKWSHPPFDASIDGTGNIYARGSQDMKCVGLQYLEAIRNLKSSNFEPLRTIYITFVLDEEIGGHDGAEKFANSEIFDEMNVGIVFLKAGLKAEGEVVSVNMVFLKAGTPSPTGFVMNLQPSEAQAGFDIRVPPIADQASLERRIAEEWAPASRNMTFEFKQKVSVYDKNGRPILTPHDGSNPWWALLEGAIHKADRKFGKPEIFPARQQMRAISG